MAAGRESTEIFELLSASAGEEPVPLGEGDSGEATEEGSTEGVEGIVGLARYSGRTQNRMAATATARKTKPATPNATRVTASVDRLLAGGTVLVVPGERPS